MGPRTVFTPKAPAAMVQGDAMKGDIQESKCGYFRLDGEFFFNTNFAFIV